ncbi:MAG: hypothetical protein V3T05_00075 [Myxococcota bacterium]
MSATSDFGAEACAVGADAVVVESVEPAHKANPASEPMCDPRKKVRCPETLPPPVFQILERGSAVAWADEHRAK